MIDKLSFEKEDTNNYSVFVGQGQAGKLMKKGKAWFFEYSDENGLESIEYYDSLKETQEELQIEYEDGLSDDTADSFGAAKYERKGNNF